MLYAGQAGGAVEGVGADNTWVPRGDLGTDTGCMSEVELA